MNTQRVPVVVRTSAGDARSTFSRGLTRRSGSARRAASIAFVVGASTLLAACGAASTPAPASDGELSGVVTVWSWDKPTTELQVAAAAFEEEHPGVTVSVENVGNPAIWDKMTAGMAAGGQGLPDVMNVGIDYIAGYVENFPDGLANLSELGADEHAGKFPEGVWNSAARDGQVYGVPFEVNSAGFFYRTDLLDEAGADIEDVETWDDLVEVGVAVKEATGKALLGIDKSATQADAANLFQQLLQQQGQFYFDESGDITLSTPEAVRAMTIIKDLNDAGVVADVSQAWDPWMQSISNGDVAVVASAAWVAGVLQSDLTDMSGQWGLRLPPAVEEGGLTAAITGATYLSVAESSENKQAAWEFVEFALTQEESQLAMYEEGGLFPGLTSVWQTPDFVTPSEYFGGQSPNEVFVDQLGQDLPTTNFTSDYAQALKAVTDAQTQVLLSGADPQAALEAAEKQLASQTGRSIAGG
ncbi:ABC transporter substrate-binding protein [Oerskovia flava]|uniref:ABC transporter substrate-binding protein n=1 Tax=Oerskovia flava TaxID=2986422 RepID=UPI00223F9A7E|nr:sugar ABC transporter substrate-binding protein [Oerskovia sp. JB1-3-2]